MLLLFPCKKLEDLLAPGILGNVGRTLIEIAHVLFGLDSNFKRFLQIEFLWHGFLPSGLMTSAGIAEPSDSV
jgi:hypothetical protein